MIRLLCCFAMVAVVLVSIAATSQAGDRKEYYSKGPQVKGYAARRGGYSYMYSDSVNTYGDSRTKYGGANVFRDPDLDKQTTAGPFDHGFFFDSGTRARGGDSPYMN